MKRQNVCVQQDTIPKTVCRANASTVSVMMETGNGVCLCEMGWDGEFCDKCSRTFEGENCIRANEDGMVMSVIDVILVIWGQLRYM